MASKKNLTEELKERNKTQKQIYITEDNIDIIFGHGEKDDLLCYEKLLNLCRQKVTKYFGNTQDFIQKEEIAFISISRVYAAFKNKLRKMKEANKDAHLFFYLSQLYSYIDLAVRNNVIYYKKHDKKIKQNTLLFMEDVDYTAPIETFIGHDCGDFSEQVFDEKMIDKNGEVYCHNNIQNFLLDTSLENKQNEINFNKISEILNKYFNEEEIKVIRSIYIGNEENNEIENFGKKIGKIKDKISNNEYLKNKLYSFLKDN